MRQSGAAGSRRDGRSHTVSTPKPDQPLTEPATKPETIHFWQKMKKINTGSNASTVMVIKLGQSVEN